MLENCTWSCIAIFCCDHHSTLSSTEQMAYISRSTCRFTNLVLGCFLLFIARAGSFTIRGLSGGIESGSRIRPFRREISEFSKSGPAWDLFVLSLQKLQGVAPNDSLSFFQIASIHGYPAQPWDNVMGRGPNGFCMHSSVLFPIWHRPYLALYEVRQPPFPCC